jgi:hypothetical protein
MHGTTRKIKTSQHGLGSEDGGDLLDEDHTARIHSAVLGRHGMAAASSENVAVPQRMKRLAERNKLVCRPVSFGVNNDHSNVQPQTNANGPVSVARTVEQSCIFTCIFTVFALLVTDPPVITPQESPLSGFETERPLHQCIHTIPTLPALHCTNSAHPPTAVQDTIQNTPG